MPYMFRDDGAYIRVLDRETGAVAAIVKQRDAPVLHEALSDLLVEDANDCRFDDPALDGIIGLKLDIVISLAQHMQATGMKKSELAKRLMCSIPVLEVILRGDSSIRNLIRACQVAGAKVSASVSVDA
jgi:hypothetical protein